MYIGYFSRYKILKYKHEAEVGKSKETFRRNKQAEFQKFF